MSLNIAIIPARGGSKRLPNKNIKILAGKPLISWSIEAAINSGLFDIVFVSTDQQKIADIAITAGAYVPFLRPIELATDTASTSDVISHVVTWIEKSIDQVSTVTLLQPTSPLRNEIHIKEAHELYKLKKASAVISVCELEHPIQYCNVLPKNLSMKDFINKENHKRTQELDKYYRLNGAIYIISRFLVDNIFDIYSDNSFGYIMEKEYSIDIDDAFDFTFAEYMKLKS